MLEWWVSEDFLLAPSETREKAALKVRQKVQSQSNEETKCTDGGGGELAKKIARAGRGREERGEERASLRGVRREVDLNGSSVKVTSTGGNTHMEVINWQLLHTEYREWKSCLFVKCSLPLQLNKDHCALLPATDGHCDCSMRMKRKKRAREKKGFHVQVREKERTNHTGCSCDTVKCN